MAQVESHSKNKKIRKNLLGIKKVSKSLKLGGGY